jgi:hypothetical protein
MTRDEVERKIRDVLATEQSAIRLSSALFTPAGLFSHLAADEAERRVLVTSALFREAQRRLSELQRAEMAEFKQEIADYEATHDDPVLRRLEAPTSHAA